MNILVTGSSGFIGSYLSKKLEVLGHNVLCFSHLDGDIQNFNFNRKYKNVEIDLIYHLAGKTFVPDSWIDPSSFISTNALGTLNILKFSSEKKIPFIYVSAYIYGIPSNLPIKENSFFEPNNPYAFSKYLAEKFCIFFSKFSEMDINIFRPFNIYGIGQDERFLVPEILSSIKNKKSIKVNSLLPKRDYIYIDDVVDALIKGMKNLNGLNVYNLGSGSSLSVKQIIEAIQKESNTEFEVISKNIERINEIEDVIADISAAKKDLKWQPQTSFNEGIKKMINKIN
jgi:nucleoside-diphosphate-sugar epimerase